ncbi:MAG: D-2-hydroxyacid dehydrogenase [Burkholderiales bacterium]
MSEKLHLHLENSRMRSALFHLTEEKWAAAAKRHKALAKNVRVTVGWDGDILDDALRTADVMINSSPPREKLRERAPRLKWIQTTGAGVDQLAPFEWLPEDISLTNNSGAHGAKAEDSCTMALLMLNAGLPELLTNQRERRWQQIFSTPIEGKKAVVIGFGDLGQAAGRAAKKLDMELIAVTRSGKHTRPADVTYPVSRIDRALPKADFVIVTTPLTADTRGLISRERLGLLKHGAGLVNIGRAPVVDYAALTEKLVSGDIGGAVLDVFDQEPLPADSPLWTTPNLVIMPHISCDDPRYIDQLFDTWFMNLERFMKGKTLRNIVDRRLGY